MSPGTLERNDGEVVGIFRTRVVRVGLGEGSESGRRFVEVAVLERLHAPIEGVGLGDARVGPGGGRSHDFASIRGRARSRVIVRIRRGCSGSSESFASGTRRDGGARRCGRTLSWPVFAGANQQRRATPSDLHDSLGHDDETQRVVQCVYFEPRAAHLDLRIRRPDDESLICPKCVYLHVDHALHQSHRLELDAARAAHVSLHA